MNVKINLAARGWIPASETTPPGNYLVWKINIHEIDNQEIDNQNYLGLPETVKVQRAQLKDYHVFIDNLKLIDSEDKQRWGGYQSLLLPNTFWQELSQNLHDPLDLTSSLPCRLKLPKKVQAVLFKATLTKPTRMLVYEDDGSDRPIINRMIESNETVLVEAACIKKLIFLTNWIGIQQLWVLNLAEINEDSIRKMFDYTRTQFTFTDVAVINVKSTANISWEKVSSRFPVLAHARELDIVSWEDILKLIGAMKEPPEKQTGTKDDPKPSVWEVLQLLMGTKFEIADTCGFGFIDGPLSRNITCDEILCDASGNNKLLTQPLSNSLAVYKIEVRYKNLTKSSNLVFCPPQDVPDLGVPDIPEYLQPEVRLQTMNDAAKEALPEEADESHYYNATMRLKCGLKNNPNTTDIGLCFKERQTAPPDNKLERTFEYRSRHPEDFGNFVTINRNFPVSSYATKLQCCAWFSDYWGRKGEISNWSQETSLKLIHIPLAPPLKSVTHDSKVKLERMTKINDVPASRADRVLREDVPAWEPDRVLREIDGSNVKVYRRNNEPLLNVQVTVFEPPTFISGTRYRTKTRCHTTDQTTTREVSEPQKFSGGHLISGVAQFPITSISLLGVFPSGSGFDIDYIIEFEALPNSSPSPSTVLPGFDSASPPSTLPTSPGAARLQQAITHEALWESVENAEFTDLVNLPNVLTFSDNLPLPVYKFETVQYCLRAAYPDPLTRLMVFGPSSNIVSLTLSPPLPDKLPPPFRIQLWGTGFFNETLVRVEFNEPQTDLNIRYSVHFARGTYSMNTENQGDSTSEAIPGSENSTNQSDFAEKAIPGRLGAQCPYNSLYLYEILPLPVPTSIDQPITVGVRAVNSVGDVSGFTIVTDKIPASGG